MKTKSPLPWFGSDAGVAPELATMLDDCSHVTIPFCGGMSILPHLKARAIVANDAHEDAINFYQVMNEHEEWDDLDCQKLIQLCQETLSHPAVLETSKGLLNDTAPYDKGVYRAWAFWSMCWIGRKGKGGTKHQGGMPSVRRTANGGTNASRIQSAAADLEAWAAEFKRCEFTCEDFRDCLGSVADQPGCGIYVDPPWFGAGRKYLHRFSDDDHLELAESLSRFENTKVVIRYGDCIEIRRLYANRCWHITKATSRTQANKEIGEIWITNQKEREHCHGH